MSMVMDMDAVCNDCIRFDFGALGFCGSDRPLPLVYRLRERTFDQILQNLEHCNMCRTIDELFREWVRQLPQAGANPHDVNVDLVPYRIEGPEAKLLRLKVVLSFPKPTPQFYFSMQIQKCSPHSPEVSELCTRGSLIDWESGDSEQHAYGGRIRPLVADTRLFCRWVETCCAMHGDACSFIVNVGHPHQLKGGAVEKWCIVDDEDGDQLIRRLRLVDVKNRCIDEKRCVVEKMCVAGAKDGSQPHRLRLIDVEGGSVADNETGSGYVALSYVWGEWRLQKQWKRIPKLSERTEAYFREPGSLTREKVLSTIDDAIEVTRSLGMKYLWVDCLCILQKLDGEDSNPLVEADQLEFLPRMDLIYAFAFVTVVAASGTDASAGLPGINPGSRGREQKPFTVKEVSLLRTLDPEGSAKHEFRNGMEPSYMAGFEWYRRGWTFQEILFSGRALIFTPEQVYWQCQRASWCEDGLWENKSSIYRHIFSSTELRHPWALDDQSFDLIYRKLVEEYSSRSLTYEGDGLNAFKGILNALLRQAGRDFLWALPASFLDTALSWPCESPAERRRGEQVQESSAGTSIRCPFPSWSWVGWKGKVPLYSRRFKLNWIIVGLIFYYLDNTGSVVQVPVQVHPILSRSNSEDSNPSPIFLWKDQSKTIVNCEDVPQSVFNRSIASNILLFWSSAAKLHIRAHGSEIVISTKADNGREIFGAWSHMPLLAPGHKELAEFVVIGIENPHNTDGFLALLLISLDSDGVAHRRGLVNIDPSEWALLDNLEWKLIFLG